MPSLERSAHHRETLLFTHPEQGQEFKQHVTERLQRETGKVVRDDREVVAGQVAQEFARHGDVVDLVREPWEHTPAEHAEAQRLVDITFSQDLPAALKVARQSPSYPRILDLFHDVLTGELYDMVREHKQNKQPVLGWFLGMMGFVVGMILATLLIVFWL